MFKYWDRVKTTKEYNEKVCTQCVGWKGKVSMIDHNSEGYLITVKFDNGEVITFDSYWLEEVKENV